MIDPRRILDTAFGKQYLFDEPVDIDAMKPQTKPLRAGRVPITALDFGMTHRFLFKPANEMTIDECLTYEILAVKAGWPHITPQVWRAQMGQQLGLMQVYFDDGQNLGAKNGRPPLPEIFDYLKQANPNDFVRIALLDQLTSACDRHGNNIMIAPSGAVKAIDNTHLMRANRYNEIVRRSIVCGTLRTPFFSFICYSQLVYGGKIRKSFPPTFKTLLQNLMNRKIRLPRGKDFEKSIGDRARRMLAVGFEL